MARIFIRHKETGQIKNVEEIILTPHLKARGWEKHEVEKFEPKAETKEAVSEVEPTVKETTSPKPIEKATWEDLTAITQPKETKPAAKKGRKPKQQ